MGAVTLEELFKSSPRREIQQQSSGGNSSSSSSSKKKNKMKRVVVRNKSLLENLARNGDITSRIAHDGSTKMTILVKKQDLKHMLEAMHNNNNDNNNRSSLSTAERRLNDLMRKRSSANSHQGSCQGQHLGSWRPALHSIPEEHY